jgi:hypothetical protein
MSSFSERQGYSQPKEITFREELSVKLRIPVFDILNRYISSKFLWERVEKLFNPYGTDDWPEVTEAIPVMRGEDDNAVAAKRVLLNCPWFRVYDVIEDIFGQLIFFENELSTDPFEEPRAFPFQQDINNYFKHVGVGWQLVKGKIVTRGNEVFEDTVKTAVAVLEESAKPTAAGHLQFAISALSARPKVNTSGAVAHATSAVECVLGEITGQATTLGKYLDKNPALFHPALKKGLDGIYGYASSEGARHGKEGTEPSRDEAEFAVAVCAAVCTLLTRKQPK